MEAKKKYIKFKKIEHNKGDKPFTTREKGLFYRYMYKLYQEMSEKAEKLQKIETWLKQYDGSEYAIVECSSLKRYLEAKSKEAILRYDIRMGRIKS